MLIMHLRQRTGNITFKYCKKCKKRTKHIEWLNEREYNRFVGYGILHSFLPIFKDKKYKWDCGLFSELICVRCGRTITFRNRDGSPASVKWRKTRRKRRKRRHNKK